MWFSRSLAARLLTRLFGHYIENVNSDDIQVRLREGDIQLHSLRLRHDAFDGLNLPVDVVSGKLTKLVLHIPWTRISSEPSLFEAEELHVVLRPRNFRRGWDAAADRQRRRAAKQRGLDAFERARAAQATESEAQGMTESWVQSILNNLQLKVAKVHVVLEAAEGVERPFTVGFKWDSLSLVSTDADGMERFLTTVADVMHKRLALTGLQVYVDHGSHSEGAQPHRFLLEPCRLDFRLRMLSRASKDRSQPRYSIDGVLGSVTFALMRQQYVSLLELLDLFTNFNKQVRYARFRPQGASPTAAPRRWWRFAYACVVGHIRDKRRSEAEWYWWYRTYLKARYLELYPKTQSKPGPQPEERLLLQSIEAETSVADLVAWRQAVYDRLAADRAKAPAATPAAAHAAGGGGGGWWSSWWGSDVGHPGSPRVGAAEEPEDAVAIPTEPAEEEPPDAAHPQQPRWHAVFAVRAMQWRLYDQLGACLTCIAAKDLVAEAVVRRKGYVASLRLDGLSIEDCVTEGSFFPSVLTAVPIDADGTKEAQLLHVTYESEPANSSADMTLALELGATRAVFVPRLLHSLQLFWAVPPRLNLSSLEVVVANGWHQLSNASLDGLRLALAQNALLDLRLSLHAPVILMPEDCLAEHTHVVVAHLGYLHGATEIDATRAQRLQSAELVAEDFYDRMHFRLTDVRLELASASAGVLPPEPPPVPILQPVALDFAFYRCLTPDTNELHRLKLEGSIGSIAVNFTPTVYEALSVIGRNASVMSEREAEAAGELYVRGPGVPDTAEQPRWEPARLLVYPNMLLVLAKDQPHRTLICLGPRSCLSRLAQGEGDGVEEEALPLAGATAWRLAVPQGAGGDVCLDLCCGDGAAVLPALQKSLRDLQDQDALATGVETFDSPASAAPPPPPEPSSPTAPTTPSTAASAEAPALLPSRASFSVSVDLERIALALRPAAAAAGAPVEAVFDALQLRVVAGPAGLDMTLLTRAFHVVDRNNHAATRFPQLISMYSAGAGDPTAPSPAPSASAMLELKAHVVQRVAGSRVVEQKEVSGCLQGFTVNFERSTAPGLARLGADFLRVARRLDRLAAQRLRVVSEALAAPPETAEPTTAGAAELTVGLTLRGLAVNFVDHDVLLFDAYLLEATTTITVPESGRLQVTGRMGDLVVENHSPLIGAKHRRILGLGTEGQSCVEFAYTGAARAPQRRPSVHYTAQLDLRLSSVRLVYLTPFLNLCRRYLDPETLLGRQVVGADRSDVEGAVAAGMQKVYGLAEGMLEAPARELLQLNVTFQNPTFVIPVRHDSDLCAQLQLGEVSCANRLETSGEGGVANVFYIKLAGVAGTLDDTSVLQSADVSVELTSPVTDPAAGVTVRVSANRLAVVVSQPQYHQLVDIVVSNVLDPLQHTSLAVAPHLEAAATPAPLLASTSAVAAAEPVAQREAVISLDLPALELCLLQLNGEVHTSIQCLGFDQSVELTSEGYSTAIRVRSVEVHTKNDPRSLYPCLIRPAAGGGTEWLAFALDHRAAARQTAVKLTVEPLRVVVDPLVYVHLLEWLRLPDRLATPELGQLTAESISGLQESLAETVVLKEDQLSFHCCFSAPHLIIPTDCYSLDSLVTYVDAGTATLVTTDTREQSVTVRDIQVTLLVASDLLAAQGGVAAVAAENRLPLFTIPSVEGVLALEGPERHVTASVPVVEGHLGRMGLAEFFRTLDKFSDQSWYVRLCQQGLAIPATYVMAAHPIGPGDGPPRPVQLVPEDARVVLVDGADFTVFLLPLGDVRVEEDAASLAVGLAAAGQHLRLAFAAEGWGAVQPYLAPWRRRGSAAPPSSPPPSRQPSSTAPPCSPPLATTIKVDTLRLVFYEGYSPFCEARLQDFAFQHTETLAETSMTFQAEGFQLRDVWKGRTAASGPEVFVAAPGHSQIGVTMLNPAQSRDRGRAEPLDETEIVCEMEALQCAVCDRFADALELVWDLKCMYDHFDETHGGGVPGLSAPPNLKRLEMSLQRLAVHLMDVSGDRHAEWLQVTAGQGNLKMLKQGELIVLGVTLSEASAVDLARPRSEWPSTAPHTDVVQAAGPGAIIRINFETRPNSTADRPLTADRLYACFDKHLEMQFEKARVVFFNTEFYHILDYFSSDIVLRLSELTYRPLFTSECETLAMKKVVVDRPSYCLGLSLRLLFREPLLVLPVHPLSGDHLVATLPSLEVRQRVALCGLDMATFAAHIDDPAEAAEAHRQRLAGAAGPMSFLEEDEHQDHPKAAMHHVYVIEAQGAQLCAAVQGAQQVMCPSLQLNTVVRLPVDHPWYWNASTLTLLPTDLRLDPSLYALLWSITYLNLLAEYHSPPKAEATATLCDADVRARTLALGAQVVASGDPREAYQKALQGWCAPPWTLDNATLTQRLNIMGVPVAPESSRNRLLDDYSCALGAWLKAARDSHPVRLPLFRFLKSVDLTCTELTLDLQGATASLGTLKLRDFSLAFIQTEASMFLVVKQRSITVEFADDGGAPTDLLHTEIPLPAERDLIDLAEPASKAAADAYLTVQYAWRAGKEHGEAWTMQFEELLLLFHPRLSADLVAFFVPPELPVFQAELSTPTAAPVAQPRSLELAIRGITVRLVTTGGQCVAAARVNQFRCRGQQQPSGQLESKFALGDVTVTDLCHPDSLHSMILGSGSAEGGALLLVEYYRHPSDPASTPAYTQHLYIDAQALQLTLVPEFMRRLWDFADDPVVSRIRLATAETVQQLEPTAPFQREWVHVRLSINQPRLVVVQAVQETASVVLVLGTLLGENELQEKGGEWGELYRVDLDHVQARTREGPYEVRLIERWGFSATLRRQLRDGACRADLTVPHLALFASERQVRLLTQLVSAHTATPVKTTVRVPHYESLVLTADRMMAGNLVLHPDFHLFFSPPARNYVTLSLEGDLRIHLPLGAVRPVIHVEEGRTVVIRCQRIVCSHRHVNADLTGECCTFTLRDAADLGLGGVLLVECAQGPPEDQATLREKRGEQLEAHLKFGGATLCIMDEFQCPVVQCTLGSIYGKLQRSGSTDEAKLETFTLECAVYHPTQQQWEPLLEGAMTRTVTVKELLLNLTSGLTDRTLFLHLVLPHLTVNATPRIVRTIASLHLFAPVAAQELPQPHELRNQLGHPIVVMVGDVWQELAHLQTLPFVLAGGDLSLIGGQFLRVMVEEEGVADQAWFDVPIHSPDVRSVKFPGRPEFYIVSVEHAHHRKVITIRTNATLQNMTRVALHFVDVGWVMPGEALSLSRDCAVAIQLQAAPDGPLFVGGLLTGYRDVFRMSSWQRYVQLRCDTPGQETNVMFLQLVLKRSASPTSDLRRIAVRYPLTLSSHLSVALTFEGYTPQLNHRLVKIGAASVPPQQRLGLDWVNPDQPMYFRLQLLLPDGTHLVSNPVPYNPEQRKGRVEAGPLDDASRSSVLVIHYEMADGIMAFWSQLLVINQTDFGVVLAPTRLVGEPYHFVPPDHRCPQPLPVSPLAQKLWVRVVAEGCEWCEWPLAVETPNTSVIECAAPGGVMHTLVMRIEAPSGQWGSRVHVLRILPFCILVNRTPWPMQVRVGVDVLPSGVVPARVVTLDSRAQCRMCLTKGGKLFLQLQFPEHNSGWSPYCNLGEISETVLKVICPLEAAPADRKLISLRELKRRLLLLGLKEDELLLPAPRLVEVYHDTLQRAADGVGKLSGWALRRCLQRVGVAGLAAAEGEAGLLERFWRWLDDWRAVHLAAYGDWLTPPHTTPLCVQVAVTQPKDVRYAAVTAYPADSPPYLIENRTAFRLLVGQSRVGVPAYRLAPHTTRGFSWDSPTAEWALAITLDAAADPNLRLWKGLSWRLDLKDVITGRSFAVKAGGFPALGMRPPPELRCKMRHMRGGTVAVSLFTAMGSATAISRSPHTGLVAELMLNLDRFGLSIIADQPQLQEIAFLSASGVQGTLKVTPVRLGARLLVQAVQLDDQSDITPHFPVVVSHERSAVEPWQFDFDVERGAVTGLILLKSLQMKCPQLVIELHEEFLEKLVQYYAALEGALHWFVPLADLAKLLPLEPHAAPAAAAAASTIRNSKLHGALTVPEVRFDLTLLRSAQPGAMVRQYLGAASYFMFSVSHARLKLPEYRVPKTTQRVSQHLSRLSAFYMSHAMMLGLKLVGSADAVLNPVGQLKNLGGGVAGLFVKPPWESVPDLFGRAMTVGLETVSSLSGSVGQECSKALPKTYQTKLQKAQKTKPGGMFFSGIADGLKGVVADPMAEMRRKGPLGLGPGLVKGFGGLLGKPLVGLAYEISNDTSHIRRRLRGDAEPDALRVRPPRQFAGAVLTPAGSGRHVESYENQRFYVGQGWRDKLHPTDRLPWSDAGGWEPRPLDKVRPPKGWQWDGEWEKEVSTSTDPEGWTYAMDFYSRWHAQPLAHHFVRRRKWTRRCVLASQVAPPQRLSFSRDPSSGPFLLPSRPSDPSFSSQPSLDPPVRLLSALNSPRDAQPDDEPHTPLSPNPQGGDFVLVTSPYDTSSFEDPGHEGASSSSSSPFPK